LDPGDIIHIDYLQKGRTINGENYDNILDQLNEDLKKRGLHLAKNKILFHKDNAHMFCLHGGIL
jgi:Transposase.